MPEIDSINNNVYRQQQKQNSSPVKKAVVSGLQGAVAGGFFVAVDHFFPETTRKICYWSMFAKAPKDKLEHGLLHNISTKNKIIGITVFGLFFSACSLISSLFHKNKSESQEVIKDNNE